MDLLVSSASTVSGLSQSDPQQNFNLDVPINEKAYLVQNRISIMKDVATPLMALLKLIVYSIFFAIGTTLLSADPTTPFRVLPLFVGIALLIHAMYADEHRRIEVTLVAMYATLVMMLGVVTGVAVSSVSLPSFVTSDATLSVLLALVIVGVYFGQEANRVDTATAS
jgi:cadmium resistance protein CadD (predicted permease)